MLTDKYAKAAGVTMEDCLARHQVIVPTPIPTPIIEHQPPQIIVNVPQPVAQAQAELPVKEQTTEIRELPSCNVYSGVTNVCKRIVDDAIIALNENPETQLILRGPQQGAAVVQYLRSRGVSASRVQMFFGDDQNWTLNFELFTVSK
jgi:hypothetical protein